MGIGCKAMDDIEACALDATNCVDGCTGASAQQLGAFVTCLEIGWVEMLCSGGAKKGDTCIETAKIDKSKFASCKTDQSKIQNIHDHINSVGKNVHSFPKVLIDGKDASQAQDSKSILQKLCSVGVQAACSKTVVI